jgi:very-short-patch-repair endonuclease
MPHVAVSTLQRSRAKQLRRTMTPAETLLWRYLKANRIDGLGFRRQVPLGNYIADFVCMSVRLLVELDGQSHDFDAQRKADEKRDAFFVAKGFRVVRFSNQDVISNLEGVVEAIRLAASSGASGLPPSLPLPHKGGGNGKSSTNSRGLRP